jgi:hypothetical protein
MIKNVSCSSCIVPVILGPVLKKFEFIESFFSKNTRKSIFMKIRPVEAELFHAERRRDRQTYMTELITAFHNFANAPKNLQITTTFPAVLSQISSPISGT